MLKKSISRTEMLALHGLHALVMQHLKMLYDIARCAREITGEDDESGHCQDFAFDDGCSAEDLVRRLGIIVEGD